MATFEYRVRDNSGTPVRAQMEADSVAQVRDLLRAKGLTIIDIKAPGKGLNQDISIPFLDNKPPGLRVVAVFSRQLSTMINAGMPLVQALAVLQRQSESKAMKGILRSVRGDVEGGLPLSEAMAKFPKVFNRLYINLVKAGETSGALDVVLDRVSVFQEKDLALRGKVKKALTYPTIVLILAAAITYGMLMFIVPVFVNILTDLEAELPLITRLIVAISDFLRTTWWLGLLTVVGVVVGYRFFYRTPQGRRTIDALKLRIPLIGNISRKGSVATFARTFSLLTASGVNIVETLDITKGTADNAIVQETIDDARRTVLIGEPMSSSFASSPVMPPMVTSMTAIGEETGALDTMMDKVADFYEREVDEAVDSMAAALEPLMIVLIGGVIGFIVVGMFVPMFSVINAIS